MSYIIGQKCVGVCDTGCVTACPVDCIHGPIDINGSGEEVKELDNLEGNFIYDPNSITALDESYKNLVESLYITPAPEFDIEGEDNPEDFF